MMDRTEILGLIEGLSHSQGFYGRLLESFRDMEQEDPEAFEACMAELEAQNFSEPLDAIRYFEE